LNELSVTSVLLETANIQYRPKRLTSRKWGGPHWGSSCFSQRVCGLQYAYCMYLPYLRNHNIQDTLTIKGKAAVYMEKLQCAS